MVLGFQESNNIRAVESNTLASLLWYLLGRAFIVTLFLGVTVVIRFTSSTQFFHLPDIQLVTLLFLTFLQICFSLLWLLRWQKKLRLFVQLQLVWDLILSALTVYLTGGIESIFSFLFIFVILSCALLSSRNEMVMTVVATVILYSGLVGLQYYDYLPMVKNVVLLNTTDIVYRLFLNIVAFLLAGLLGSVLSTRLRRSEFLLQRNRNEYAELEKLNQMILKSIPSGLMVVDAEGKIYSFNAAASLISRVDYHAACCCTVTDLFPNFNLNAMQLPVDRGEFDFISSEGDVRIIGYNATLITGLESDSVRVLITFQDLTETKKLERNLQLGERLAAVGKLAAGLAHEIRNPLASLSGSIQLLAENTDYSTSDQRLVDIACRETSRLNSLVTDFLVFAKPRLPHKEMCDLSALCQEVILVVKSDPLFADVEVQFDSHRQYEAMIDSAHFHQVIFNLLVNAAQFSVAAKKIALVVDADNHCLYVDDNGPGVAIEDGRKIFEPFYSTRADGTGLGLSIVHTIVTAHGGTIECLSNPWGGARFQINLFGDKGVSR